MSGFNTLAFLFLFLPAFIALFYLAGSRRRLLVGLLGSLIFYAWGDPAHLPVMLGLIVINYLVGLYLAGHRGSRGGAAAVWAGSLVNIGAILFFRLWGSPPPMPLGLSYVSFQLISYLLDVSKGTLQAERGFLTFGAYVLLFPKIMVGPITRYGQVKDQLGSLEPTAEDLASGIRRFIKGLAKKVLIADFLAKIVTPVFALPRPTVAPGLAWLVIVSFAVQLYFDFSGFTDMALGLGQMMGLRFIENFNFPYISKSISEFWRRWHMSLSAWFRDYVFFPLERRRLRWLGQPINVLIVFALTGLWHGVSWTFLAWGLSHGLAIVFENSRPGKWLRSAWSPLQHLYALAVILTSWVFFRSPDLQFALRFFKRLAGDATGLAPLQFTLVSPLPIIDPSVILALVLGLIFSLPVGQWFERLVRGGSRGPGRRLWTQVLYDLLLLALAFASVGAMATSGFTPGIYDKF